MKLAMLIFAAVVFGLAFAVISRGQSSSYLMLRVMDCNGHYKRIWADSAATIPLANPLVVDRDGSYTFYASGCVSIPTR